VISDTLKAQGYGEIEKDKNKDDYSRVCYDGPVYLASDVEIE